MPTLLDRDLSVESTPDHTVDPDMLIETLPGLRLLSDGRERRRHRRYAVKPMFASVRIQGEDRGIMDGHLLDISIAGARFESDVRYEIGASLEFEIELPGGAATLRGVGHAVRVVDEVPATGDVLGAIEFDRFETRLDSATLTRYLEQGCLLRAA